MNISSRLNLIIIGTLLILVTFLWIVYSMLLGGKKTEIEPQSEEPTTEVLNSPTPVNIQNLISTFPSSKKVESAPTIQPQKGAGIDITSTYVQDSVNEIKKLKSNLPYKYTFTSSQGVIVDIYIPSLELLDNDWTLQVQTYGIDYEIGESDAEYASMRMAFLETAQNVFFWLKDQGVDTEKIIIEWGDRQFIQERSEQWLKGR